MKKVICRAIYSVNFNQIKTNSGISVFMIPKIYLSFTTLLGLFLWKNYCIFKKQIKTCQNMEILSTLAEAQSEIRFK